MKLHLDDQNEIITVWVTNGEEIPSINSVRQQCKRNSYQVAVFHSGNADIEALVSNALTRIQK